ncbi:hypothetical protein GCM10010873_26850 [Cypionkella aquatica]|uniref:HTH cro/C1-type domain-containing protein n=1 Tax=Cypionkella aquatica TaxID=1756042 RepID=A0AA37X576_9RHOB|nr:helix-turn-helix transcriptional regulator [Cypionkella aquatica]GLS87711.1 hypothetical protein GCM10010873_26850 [Cypionkella aquatica]
MKLSLTAALKRNKMSQTALADAVGVGKGFMSEIISGKKNPSMETLSKIMEVLNATPSEIMPGQAGLTATISLEVPSDHSEPASRGFSENQAKPWQGNGTEGQLNLDGLTLSIRHPVHYELVRPSPSLSLLAGDVLLVDLGTPPEAGDLILIGLIDQTGTNAATLVRRYIPPFAVTADPNEPQPYVELEKDGLASWRGTIKSMFRPKM